MFEPEKFVQANGSLRKSELNHDIIKENSIKINKHIIFINNNNVEGKFQN